MNNKKNRFLHVRNSMLYGRLSDLSLIAIERDFHVDYQRIIDVFATQHKNSRILLRPPPPSKKVDFRQKCRNGDTCMGEKPAVYSFRNHMSFNLIPHF
jgi:hypothetical protein